MSQPTETREVSDEPQPCKQCSCGLSDQTLAFLVLRAWLGIRALLAGVEKFGSYQTIQKPLIDPTTGLADPSGAMVDVKVKFYAWANYSGLPSALRDKFTEEPLLPGFVTSAFSTILGPTLILLGLMLLIGIGTRISLFLQGLLYTVLMIGLLLIKQEDGVSWLGIHVALVAFALTLAQHNRFNLLKKW